MKKTIEKQREEINSLKQANERAEKTAHETQISKDAACYQLTKEKEELEKRLKRKQDRYKRKMRDVLSELEILTQRNVYLQKSLDEVTTDYKQLSTRYEQEAHIFRLETLRKDEERLLVSVNTIE